MDGDESVIIIDNSSNNSEILYIDDKQIPEKELRYDSFIHVQDIILPNEMDEEFPPVSAFGLNLCLKRKSIKKNTFPSNIENGNAFEREAGAENLEIPYSQMALPIGKPVIFIHNEVKGKIDLPMMTSTLTSRGIIVSQDPGSEQSCIYCCLKSSKGRQFTACCLIMESGEILSPIINPLETAARNDLYRRILQLKEKYDCAFVIVVGVEKTVKNATSGRNTAYRELVSQTTSKKTTKRKNNASTLNEIQSILSTKGNAAKSYVDSCLHEVELQCGISIIPCKNKKDVIEWISGLPKALIKKNLIVTEESDIPDKIFVPKFKNKRRKTKCSETTEIRFILTKQLEEFDNFSHDMAKTIAFKYPSFRELRQALAQTSSNPEEFISSIVYKPNKTRLKSNWKQIGPAASKRIYTFLTSTDPNALV